MIPPGRHRQNFVYSARITCRAFGTVTDFFFSPLESRLRKIRYFIYLQYPDRPRKMKLLHFQFLQNILFPIYWCDSFPHLSHSSTNIYNTIRLHADLRLYP